MIREKGWGTRPAAPVPALVWLAVIGVGVLWVGVLRAEESPEARRARIENMDAAEQEQLLRSRERFAGLEPAERERLRRIHREIDDDPHAGKLRVVMHRYYEWLKTLTPYQRAELRELPPAERIERIKQLRQEQADRHGRWARLVEGSRSEQIKRLFQNRGHKGGKRPNPQDVEGLLRWVGECGTRYGPRYLEGLPEARRKQLEGQLAKFKDAARRRGMLGIIWLRSHLEDPEGLSPEGERALSDLRSKLSPATRQRLEALPADEQWRTMAGVLRLVVLHHYVARRVGPSVPPVVNEEELSGFLEKELSPAMRDRLLSLPPEEMRQRLVEMYLRSKWPESSARSPDRPSRGRGPGPKPHRDGPPKSGHDPRPVLRPAGPHGRPQPETPPQATKPQE